jgi:hypothetical protein
MIDYHALKVLSLIYHKTNSKPLHDISYLNPHYSKVMPAHNLEYPKIARNTVNRKGKSRGKYDLEVVHTIINQARVVHVSFTPLADDPFPTILPMIAVMGERVHKNSQQHFRCYD